MTLEYITARDISDKEGNLKGKIRIMKLKEENDASVELTCPGCGKVDKRKETWSEPFVTGEKANRIFTVTCKNCNFVAKIAKLKKEMKKNAKKK